MNIPKVGILTTFTGADEAYSLVNVVKVQLKMLLKAGYHPVLFVAPEFGGDGIWSGRVVEIRKVSSPSATEVDILTALRPLISDIQVMLCHDIVFLGQHREWAKALRTLSNVTNISWLHWQHSRGGHEPIDPIENSWFCYPNMGDLDHVAHINSAHIDRVQYVPHPLDFEYLGWGELAVEIAEETEFPFVDVSGLLPSRLDTQKQIEKAVRVFAGLKKANRTVRFLVADAYATGDRFVKYREEVIEIGKKSGLTNEELVFLSTSFGECKISTPREVVKSLFEMSNIFIQPSNAETSSLVVMEAALAGNLVVINSDFHPIHHLYKDALSLPFGSIFEDTKYYRHITTADGQEKRIEDPQSFWDDEARNTIIPVLDSQISISVKRQQLRDRWPSKVFSEFLEPLILKVAPESSLEISVMRGDEEITAIITTLDNLSTLQRQIPILLNECGNIIVVNNGSKDGTRAWLDSLSDERIQVIHRENKGAGPGRNAGLDLWDMSTPFVFMVDGGILPPQRGAYVLKDYLLRHFDVDVISPEIATCYTNKEEEATLRMVRIPEGVTFAQCELSGTAYALCRARAWISLRFSEEGPFAEPGWGADDNDMMFRWNDAGILHHDIAGNKFELKLLRRGSGSFQRLYEETGVWPNQYGSVYEKRNVKLSQDWRKYYDPVYHKYKNIKYSFVIRWVHYPDLAKIIKKIHSETKESHEVIVLSDGLNEKDKWFLNTFALRQPWGNVAIDAKDDKTIINRSEENEEVWTGDIIIDREPQGENVIRIDYDKAKEILT